MKIINKTPLVDEQGKFGFVERLQAMLQFGFNWPNQLQAQNTIVKYFERQLEKNFTLIQNMTLGASGIMIPMIVLGPPGIFAIEVTHLRGRYQARGESWNVESGDQYAPAPVNLIKQTKRMARALQVYIERQGVTLPAPVEPVIIAGDPGLQIESVQPAIKIMMIDGIKPFVSGLAGGQPVLSSMLVNDFTDRILTPRKNTGPAPAAPEPEPEPVSRWQETYDHSDQPQQQYQPTPSPYEADEVKPFNVNDFGFAMTEDETQAPMDDMEEIPSVSRESSPAQPIRRPKSQPNQELIMGLTTAQLAVLGALALALLCILAIFAYIILSS